MQLRLLTALADTPAPAWQSAAAGHHSQRTAHLDFVQATQARFSPWPPHLALQVVRQVRTLRLKGLERAHVVVLAQVACHHGGALGVGDAHHGCNLPRRKACVGCCSDLRGLDATPHVRRRL